MSLVVQEVLQPQELDSTERAPVTPIHRDLQLSRLRTHTQTHMKHAIVQTQQHRFPPRNVCVFYPIQLQCKLLVPGLVADWLPAGLTDHCVVQLQHCADLI